MNETRHTFEGSIAVDPATVPEPIAAERTPDVELVSSPVVDADRKRRMLELYAEIVAWAGRTRTYGWEKDGEKLITGNPHDGARLIFVPQWLEAMRVASALYGRSRVRALGAPEAIAHPSGRAGLGWRVGRAEFSVLFDARSDSAALGQFGCSWVRIDARGRLEGKSTTLGDLGEALESAFSESGGN
jgi:hypothetical protein